MSLPIKKEDTENSATVSANHDACENRLRVAMIVAGFPHPQSGGSGVFNLRAATALQSLVDLTVIHLRTWKPGRPGIHISTCEGIPVIAISVVQVPAASWNFNLAVYRRVGWRRVRSLLKKHDLIHSVEGSFVGVVASNWSRRAGIKHVTQLVGGETTDIFPRMMRSRTFAGWEENVHGVACNSQTLAKEFLALYPKARNVRTIYRGVDLACYHPSGSGAGPFTLSPPVRFLYLGGFPHYEWLHGDNTKGGRTLLAAWQEGEENLVKTGASLVIAGPRSNSDDMVAWRSRLRKPEHVYLAGNLSPEVVPRYMRSADAVLIPSMTEGLPNVAMEASACGRAVFGSSVGGIPEVVKDGETGLILPAGDVSQWKDTLLSYAKQADRLHSMGKLGRQRMESMFDSRFYAQRMFDLYNTVIGGRA